MNQQRGRPTADVLYDGAGGVLTRSARDIPRQLSAYPGRVPPGVASVLKGHPTARLVKRRAVGEPRQLTNALENAAARGRLVCFTPPTPARGNRLRTRVTLIEPRDRRPYRVRVAAKVLGEPSWTRGQRVTHRVRVAALVLLALAALAIVVFLAYAIVCAVAWVLSHLLLIIGLTVVALVLFPAAVTRVACAGLHCAGCG